MAEKIMARMSMTGLYCVDPETLDDLFLVTRFGGVRFFHEDLTFEGGIGKETIDRMTPFFKQSEWFETQLEKGIAGVLNISGKDVDRLAVIYKAGFEEDALDLFYGIAYTAMNRVEGSVAQENMEVCLKKGWEPLGANVSVHNVPSSELGFSDYEMSLHTYLGRNLGTHNHFWHFPGRAIVTCDENGIVEVVLDEEELAEQMNALIRDGKRVKHLLMEKKMALHPMHPRNASELIELIESGQTERAENYIRDYFKKINGDYELR